MGEQTWRDTQFYDSDRGLWVLPVGVADEEIRRLEARVAELEGAARAADDGCDCVAQAFEPGTKPHVPGCPAAKEDGEG